MTTNTETQTISDLLRTTAKKCNTPGGWRLPAKDALIKGANEIDRLRSEIHKEVKLRTSVLQEQVDRLSKEVEKLKAINAMTP